MAFPFNMFRKKSLEPKLYLLSCSKCGYSEEIELQNKNVEIMIPQEEICTEQFRVVSELPKKCPECSVKLKHEQIPSKIRY